MSSKRILVVDDAPFIREIVKQILDQESDFDFVGEAENGIEAISQAIKLRPDYILMDIVMPELSGIKATEEILKQIPEIKIIAFTTMDHSHIHEQARSAGCLDYLKKPFTKKELVECLKSLEV